MLTRSNARALINKAAYCQDLILTGLAPTQLPRRHHRTPTAYILQHNAFADDYHSDPVKSSKHTKSILQLQFRFSYFIMHYSRRLDLLSLIFRIRWLPTTPFVVCFIANFAFGVNAIMWNFLWASEDFSSSIKKFSSLNVHKDICFEFMWLRTRQSIKKWR